MKKYWQQAVTRIDALSLRERVIVFAMAALLLVTLVNSFLLDPQFARQKQLAQKIRQDQSQITAIQTQIEQTVRTQATDPDGPNRQRQEALQQQAEQIRLSMRNMQSGLVSPDKMAELLGNILKRHGDLQLISLRKLATINLVQDMPSTTAADHKNENGRLGASVDGIYRHGVEITVQGSYLDMMSYMVELEKMPWQLFWGKARLNVEEYPRATLVLTLYTLSLEKSWLNL